MHIRFADRDIAEPYNRVHRNAPAISLLADKLVMDLAFGRHINHRILPKPRLTGQAASGPKAALVGIAGFHSGHSIDTVNPCGNAVFGESANPNINLTTATHRSAATDRVNIYPQLPRRGQYRRSPRHPPLATGWRENDFDIIAGVCVAVVVIAGVFAHWLCQIRI